MLRACDAPWVPCAVRYVREHVLHVPGGTTELLGRGRLASSASSEASPGHHCTPARDNIPVAGGITFNHIAKTTPFLRNLISSVYP